MPFPHHLLQISTYRSEPVLAALAVVALGMFIGAWVIGPALTHNNADAPASAPQARTTFEDMVARPDPPPYRAATPAFDLSGPPNYAATAKEKARAEAGEPDGDAAEQTPDTGRSRWRGRVPDRHTGVPY